MKTTCDCGNSYFFPVTVTDSRILAVDFTVHAERLDACEIFKTRISLVPSARSLNSAASPVTHRSQGEFPSLFCAVLLRQIPCFRNVSSPFISYGRCRIQKCTEGDSVNCSQVLGGTVGYMKRYINTSREGVHDLLAPFSNDHPSPPTLLLKIYAPACTTQLVSRLLDKLFSVLPRFPNANTLTMFPPPLRWFGSGSTFTRYIRRCSKTQRAHACLASSPGRWRSSRVLRRRAGLLLVHSVGV